MFGLTKPQYQTRQLLQAQTPEYPLASAWSHDGNWLAVGCADGSITLHHFGERISTQHWQAHTTPVQCLQWNPLEALLTSAGQDGRICHWRCTAGSPAQLQNELALPAAWIETLAWRPDGLYLASAAGRKACIHDRQGKLCNELDFGASTIAALAWHPRGTSLALAGYQGIQLYTGVVSRPQRTTLKWQGSLLNCHWSPDGTILAACCQDNAVHFWRVNTRRDAQMSGYPGKPRALAFTPDGRYLLTGGSSALIVWDFADGGPEGRPPRELDYHRETVNTLAVEQRSGLIAAGSKDGVVSLWENTQSAHPCYHFMLPAAAVALHWSWREGHRLLTACDESGHTGVWELYIG